MCERGNTCDRFSNLNRINFQPTPQKLVLIVTRFAHAAKDAQHNFTTVSRILSLKIYYFVLHMEIHTSNPTTVATVDGQTFSLSENFHIASTSLLEDGSFLLKNTVSLMSIEPTLA